MTISIKKDHQLYHTSMQYALSCMAEAGTFEKYYVWLKTEPVASFKTDEGWSYNKKEDTITYTEDETDDGIYVETYPVTAHITLDDELILHSTRAMSFFFRLNHDDSVTALYVD